MPIDTARLRQVASSPTAELMPGPLLRQAADEIDRLNATVADELAAKRIAADSANRFRDVLADALGHEDDNPGDDVLVAELRAHFDRTGPEPTRWRDVLAGARAQIDQLDAAHRDGTDGGEDR